MFRAPDPDETELPSTPPRAPRGDLSLFSPNDLSTTPAGPPPRSSLSHVSTTPQGAPPADFYSSVAFGSDADGPARYPDRVSAARRPLERGSEAWEDAMQDDIGLLASSQFPGAIQRFDLRPEDAYFFRIARSLAPKPAKLVELDALVLQSEEILERLFRDIKSSKQLRQPQLVETSLMAATRSLCDLWESGPDPPVSGKNRIGPAPSSSPLSKAAFLGNLVLNLHHPSPTTSRRGMAKPRPIPEVLVQWLSEHHDPYAQDNQSISIHRINPTAHERFWDGVFNLLARGSIAKVIELLKAADFQYAVTALDDGSDAPGYTGIQLINIQQVIARAIHVLESCPAVKSMNWDVAGSEWTMFRSIVHQAFSDLQAFAEGETADQLTGLETTHQEMSTLSQLSRKAQSHVPWSIYQNLEYLYGQLLGTQQEITAASQDFLENVLCSAIWWDGSDNEDANATLAISRRFSHRPNSRLVDLYPRKAYDLFLCRAFQRMMTTNDGEDSDGFDVDPNDLIQVGLGCALQGDMEGLVCILQSWSHVVADSVVEVAGHGGWLGDMQIPSDETMGGLDQQDMIVFDYGREHEKSLKKDDVLAAYANLLAARAHLRADHTPGRDGWQLAIQVLSRLDNQQMSNDRIAALLKRLELVDAKTVEQAMSLCENLGLTTEARHLSSRFADHLLEQGSQLGDALIYYARAHESSKLKHTLGLLVSYTLIQSSAYPPASDLDSTLQALVSSPGATLDAVRRQDSEAADLLVFHLSGYATIRKYYESRTQGLDSSGLRQKTAANNLVTAISSAADNIHGGLIAAGVESVLDVDGLIILLGESLMFLRDQDSVFTSAQVFTILKAIEDLSLAPQEVYQRCDEAFRAAIAGAHGAEVPQLKPLLSQQPNSSLSGSSFSLLNSEILVDSATSSGVIVHVKRAHDWRQGFSRAARSQDLLAILRLGLAKEIGRMWMNPETSA